MKNIEFINAGAGSGKTYRLTHILADNIKSGTLSANQVILTTFTEKAAGEFRAKATEALLEAGCHDQANLLASAAIGTVHGVAFQLIKKYWYFLGVSPDLQVMPEEDVAFYFNQALANIPEPEEINQLGHLAEKLRFVDFYSSTDYNLWKKHLERIRELAITNRIDDLNDSLNASLAEIKEVFPIEVEEKIKEYFNEEGLKQVIQGLKNLLVTEKETKARDKRIRQADTILDKPNWGLPELVQASSVLEDTTNNHRNNIPEINNWLNKLGQIYHISEFVEYITSYTSLVFDLAQRSLDAFKKYKKTNRLVDFNDMEDMLLILLEKDDFRNEIRESFKQIYVDEFQDSSPIQVKIFSLLSEIVEKSYWVGDPKQAIFGFRGTDPGLIKAIINRFEDGDDGLSISNLQHSWRSRPSIVKLCNTIFTPALSNQVREEYIPLTPIRNDDELLMDDLHHPLQHWHTRDDDNRGKNELKWRHLATRVYSLLNEDVHVVDKNKCKYSVDNIAANTFVKRKLKPKDIAILCRQNRAVAEITKALREVGIQVAGEQMGLNETLEARLLIAAVNYMIDPNDQLARSILVRLCGQLDSTEQLIDDRLSYLFGANAPTPYLETTRDDTPEDKGDTEREAWYNHLNRWQQDTPLLVKLDALQNIIATSSVPSVIKKVVIEGGLYDLVQLWSNSGQRTANLQSLIKKSTEYDERCLMLNIGPSLKGFVKYIEDQDPEKFRQSSDAGDDAIRVLTYHKSKGLEWPLVILTELETDATTETTLINKSFFGVSLDGPREVDPINPFEGKFIKLIPWPFGSIRSKVPEDFGNRIKNLERYRRIEQNELEETLRLLYVGYTRPRDILVTTSYRNKPLSWVKKVLQNYSDIALDALENEPDGNRMLDLYGLGLNALLKVSSHGVDDPYPDQPNSVQVIMKPQTLRVEDEGEQHDLEPMSKLKYVSPSKVAYVDSGNITISEIKNFNHRIETGKAEPHAESELGDCLHQIFSIYNFGTPDDRFLEIATQTISKHKLHGWLDHPGHVVTAIKNLYDFLSKNYGPAIRVYNELALQMEEDGQIFRGDADLVWETTDQLILVDYKSYPGKISHVMDINHAKYTGRYAGQLFTYKRMLERAHPENKSVSEVLVYYPILGFLVKVG